MQIANVKHSHCEAKFGFRVWETKFGRVHRKTSLSGERGRCTCDFINSHVLLLPKSLRVCLLDQRQMCRQCFG